MADQAGQRCAPVVHEMALDGGLADDLLEEVGLVGLVQE